MKKYYYVLIATDEPKFVTKINNANKQAWWNKNEKPLAITKSYAEDLAYCLSLNMYPAFVFMSYWELDEQIFCKKSGE